MNEKPVVLVVMDGVGLSDKHEGNAVYNAYTPNLDNFFNYYIIKLIKKLYLI